MISCRFVYLFANGGASDSLNQVYSVHALPKVGETLCFIGGDGEEARNEVKEVVHHINPTDGTHEIVVYYGGKTSQ
jgi:hypothetical protein